MFLNGVCRHEHEPVRTSLALPFLNGVCRHELNPKWVEVAVKFLNGVCRHELATSMTLKIKQFLNGVCRHEPKLETSELQKFGIKEEQYKDLFLFSTNLMRFFNRLFSVFLLNHENTSKIHLYMKNFRSIG